MHSLEQASGYAGLYVNANKAEIMVLSFKHERATFTLSGVSLKLVDQFIYKSSSISSTESDANTRLAKVGILTLSGYLSYGNLIYQIK